MEKISRRVFLAGGAAIATVAASRWSLGPAIAQTNRVVNLYSARHYDSDRQIYDSFTRKTGIKVNLIEADADQLIERIKSEGVNSPADVLITVDAGRLWRASEAGILQPIKSKVLQQSVPKNLRDPQDLWFGLSERARIIVYNKERINPAQLSTYEDLANSKWKGRVIARSSNHVYNQSLVASLLVVHGAKKTETWAKGLVANFARPPEGNDTAQIRAVASGLADLTLVNTYYVARLAKSNKPDEKAISAKIGVFFPNQRDRGAHVNICGGGVVKTSRNREAAIRFLEFLVSREAQEIFAKSNNEYPVLAGVAVDSVLASFGNFKRDRLSAAVIGKNNPEALKIMDRAGWK